jgi:LacI family transcriptional regulator
MAVTMKDVALRAGVSIRTVSRAINNLDDVSPQTREKILGVAGDLGFRPSQLARALVTHRSRSLGVSIPQLSNPFFAEFANGVYTTAREHGYCVILNNLGARIDKNELESWNILCDHGIDGMITSFHYGREQVILDFARIFKPILILMTEIKAPGISSINAGLQAGAEKAVEYLIGQGHRRIALLAFQYEDLRKIERSAGYLKVMAENNLPPLLHLLPSGPREDYITLGYSAGLQLIEKHPEVSAVFAYNDMLAIGMIQAIKKVGRRVPQDCAVIGCDDISFASIITPPLTTLRLDQFELGRRSVMRLLEMIEEPERVFDPISLEVELVLRESA